MYANADHTELRERIYIVKACVRHIVHACAERMMIEDRDSLEFETVRQIQQKYGVYLYDSLERTNHEELENILIITPALVKRILNPKDALGGIL